MIPQCTSAAAEQCQMIKDRGKVMVAQQLDGPVQYTSDHPSCPPSEGICSHTEVANAADTH